MLSKKKAVYILLSLVGILALALTLFTIWRTMALSAPINTVKSYITALASGDAETALKYASGEAALAATRLKTEKVAASVDDVTCSITSYGNGWVTATTRVRLINDGTGDIGWYSLDLNKDGQGWKVISLREAVPTLSGAGRFISKQDVALARKTFTDYLDRLTLNDLKGAENFLAGQARRQQEMSAPAMGKAPIIKAHGDVKLSGIWEKGGLLVCRAEYQVDGRDVKSIVTLAEVKAGQWRIVNIQQAGA